MNEIITKKYIEKTRISVILIEIYALYGHLFAICDFLICFQKTSKK